MLGFVLSWEQWVASVQFCHNAAKRPHVDTSGVGDAEDDLRSPVETTLDICVNALVLEAAATIVDNFDTRLVRLFKKDILRLQITVDNLVVALELERLEDLNRESANQTS